MGVLDKFLDVMKLNGDDDEYDDDSTMKMTILKMSHMKKRSQKEYFWKER